jgi:hypothetical protein
MCELDVGARVLAAGVGVGGDDVVDGGATSVWCFEFQVDLAAADSAFVAIACREVGDGVLLVLDDVLLAP